METQIKVTNTGSYSAKFEHDDVAYRVDWEDDSSTVYFFQEFNPTPEGRKIICLPVEVIPTLMSIFKTIEGANLK